MAAKRREKETCGRTSFEYGPAVPRSTVNLYLQLDQLNRLRLALDEVAQRINRLDQRGESAQNARALLGVFFREKRPQLTVRLARRPNVPGKGSASERRATRAQDKRGRLDS